jgi:hypothetical protein
MGMKYHSLRSPSVLRKRRERFYITSVLSLLVGVVFLLFLSQLSLVPELSIMAIKVEGNAAVPESAIVSLVRSQISGDYLGLFSRSSILLYPERSIERDLLNQYPRFETVSVYRTFPSDITVQVVERKPAAIACISDTTEDTRPTVGGCWFIDADGTLFAEAPEFSGRAFTRFVIKENFPSIGHRLDTTPAFSEILFFLKQLEREGLEFSDVIFLPESRLDLRLLTGGTIILSDAVSISQAFINIKTLLDDGDLRQSISSRSFDYLDLRYGNKIFYKNRN